MTSKMMRDRSSGVNPLSAAEVAGQDLDALFLVWLVSRSVEDLLNRTLLPVGLTADELAVYSVLAERPLSPSELSRWMAAPSTTVSSYVKRLAARGHVEQQAHPTDGRSYRLALTAAGRRSQTDAVSLVAPVRDRVTALLDAHDVEVRRALGGLRVVVDQVRAGT